MGINKAREREIGGAWEVKSKTALDRSVKKSTNGSFHMWEMHSLEHTDISTHSVINLFLLLLSLPPYISPYPASHHSLFAKSYEADFPFKCQLVCHRQNWQHVSLFFHNELEQRLSALIMCSKKALHSVGERVLVSPSATKPRHLEDVGNKGIGEFCCIKSASSHLLALPCLANRIFYCVLLCY